MASVHIIWQVRWEIRPMPDENETPGKHDCHQKSQCLNDNGRDTSAVDKNI